MDFFASHDFEDIISVLDGRIEIENEIKIADKELKIYLYSSFRDMLENRYFHDALPGHFIQYGDLANDRIELLLNKIEHAVKAF
jgi:hypothetical protein